MRFWLAFLFLGCGAISAHASDIDVADGLVIHLVADDDLAPDCTTLAVDAEGNVVVSGPGYIRRLIDRDADGQYDDSQPLVLGPAKGAHGLCFDSGWLYFVGDDGVWRVSSSVTEGDRDAPERVLTIKTGGEHDAHALRKGPDGFWYLIAGNGPKDMYALQNVDDPIIPNPRAGVIWRISPDWSGRQVWAHGFRNAYDFDFAPNHSIDTFDSDGEREVSLPWYQPIRVFRVREGDDAGWLSRSCKRPNLDPQMPQVLAEFGRGSPTGVVRYRHGRLPDRFHNGVFVLDWTFGRIAFVGDDGRTEMVAVPAGTAGFAVTDVDVTADGRLVVSVGGRRSRGGVYVIDAVKPLEAARETPMIWTGNQSPQRMSEVDDRIIALRNQRERAIDRQAAALAIRALTAPRADGEAIVSATTLLIESVGGLGSSSPDDPRGPLQAAAVFDSCRSRMRPDLGADLVQQATRALIRTLRSHRSDRLTANELVRAIAVIESPLLEAYRAIEDDMDHVNSPTDRLHRLMALARLPVDRSDAMTSRVVEALIEIPVQVFELNWKVDRNWTPRLAELLAALAERDPSLPGKLVSEPDFGHHSHLVWTEGLPSEVMELARERFLARSADSATDPDVARFLAAGNEPLPREMIDRWLDDDITRPAAWLAIARHPDPSDVNQLRQATFWIEKSVRDAATTALKRIGADVPERPTASDAIAGWLARSDSILALKGDPEKGKALFGIRQCSHCHDGAKALGPSLAGINKRFSSRDLFRATVDPGHTIPDRYRAKIVLTTDGEILFGMPIYESVDGLTLLTTEAKTLRINAEVIAEARSAEKSLMPDGLLLGLSDTEAADLLAYMRSL